MRDIKAVVTTAGFGTRMFPVTVAVNKSLLPVGNRPVIDYLLAELLQAGIREIAFVTMPGDDSIRRYVQPPEWIARYFHTRGWAAKYAPVAAVTDRLTNGHFTWIEQPLDSKYGTAVPALLAQDFVGNSDWLLLTGDDIVLRHDGGSDLAELITARDRASAPAAMQVVEVPNERLSNYGIIRTCPSQDQGNQLLLDGVVEKPAHAEAPSNLASISRFLIGPDFFDYLATVEPHPTSKEYLSITALEDYAKAQAVLVQPIKGNYYDCGNTTDWLKANIAVQEALND